MFVTIQLIIQRHTYLLRRRLNLTLQGSAHTYFRWSGQFII